jgi:hypothetical protein
MLVFQSRIPMLYCDTVPQGCIPILFSNTLFQDCIPNLYSRTLCQNCIPGLYIPRLYCVKKLYSLTVLCIPRVYSKTAFKGDMHSGTEFQERIPGINRYYIRDCIFSRDVFRVCISRLFLKAVIQDSVPGYISDIYFKTVFQDCILGLCSRNESTSFYFIQPSLTVITELFCRCRMEELED